MHDDTSYANAFEIKQVGSSSTWEVVTTKAAKNRLNHEIVDDIEMTVTVTDGAGASDTVDIDFDIDDVNEAPVKASDYSDDAPGGAAITVNQSAQQKQFLWIKLHEFWEDLDDRQDADDLTFKASSNVPWIKVLHQPQPWEDIQEGDDDVKWGEINVGNNVLVAGVPSAGEEPEDGGDRVVVIEIDRTKANNKQADVDAGGIITLTATDEGGLSKDETIKVNVTDENLLIGANEKAVTLSGSTREGATLTATFDETKDPDLVGDPEAYQVVYTWRKSNNEDGTRGEIVQQGLSNRYKITQGDVDHRINVEVTYRELEVDGATMDFTDSAQSAGPAVVLPGTVRNVNDRGVPINFNIFANENGLTSEVTIIDEDGLTGGDAVAVSYTWQQSANGLGGWTDSAGQDTSNVNLALEDGGGAYYRLVVEYTDAHGAEERHVSERVKVGDLAAPASAPSLTGLWAVGGTQRVNVPETAEVQWQQLAENGHWTDIEKGPTLAITRDYAGEDLRVVVTHTSKDGITSTTILPSSTGQAISDITNTAPTATMTEGYEIEAQIDDTKVVTKVTHTVPVATLFDDLDGDTLTYTVTAGPGTH